MLSALNSYLRLGFGTAAFTNFGLSILDSFSQTTNMGLWQWPCLAFMVALAFSSVQRPVQFMIAGAAVCVVTLALMGAMSTSDWAVSGRTAGLLSSFVLAISLLREGATGSSTVQRASKALIAQTPSRIYRIVTLGGHMLTLLIGFGSVALIVSALHSVKKNAQQQNSPGNDLLQAPSLAAMRTYSATFLWAPFTVPYAMVHQAFPALTWLELAPWGVAASFCYITLGMVMNSYDLHPPTHVGAGTTSLQALWPLAGLLAFLGLIQGMIVEVTHLDLPRSLIVMAAPITLVWVSVQLNAPSIAVFRRLLMQRCRHIFSNVAFNTRTEISIGTVSAALGAVILTQLDLPSINQGLMASGWSVNLILISALLVQVALAWLGVNPFVTIYVAAHVLAQIEMLSHLHLVIALLELTVAAVVSGFGPWTLPMQMIANILNVRALTIAIYWNGRFSFCVLILTILLLILI